MPKDDPTATPARSKTTATGSFLQRRIAGVRNAAAGTVQGASNVLRNQRLQAAAKAGQIINDIRASRAGADAGATATSDATQPSIASPPAAGEPQAPTGSRQRLVDALTALGVELKTLPREHPAVVEMRRRMTEMITGLKGKDHPLTQREFDTMRQRIEALNAGVATLRKSPAPAAAAMALRLQADWKDVADTAGASARQAVQTVFVKAPPNAGIDPSTLGDAVAKYWARLFQPWSEAVANAAAGSTRFQRLLPELLDELRAKTGNDPVLAHLELAPGGAAAGVRQIIDSALAKAARELANG